MKYLIAFSIGLIVVLVLANLSRSLDKKLHGDQSVQTNTDNDHKEQNNKKKK